MVHTDNHTNTNPPKDSASPPSSFTLSFKHTTAETHTASGGGGGGACAVCKHQRRKCPPDCPLAPHFPAYKQRDFLNVHKLFGVRNLTRALTSIDKRKTHDFMVSVIYEANARAADPVGGCLGLIHNLNNQLKYTMLELDIVNQQLAFYRSRHQQQLQMAAETFDLPTTQLVHGYDGSSRNTGKQHIMGDQEPLDGEVSFAGSVKLSDGIALIDNSIKAKEEGEDDLKNAASKFSLRK